MEIPYLEYFGLTEKPFGLTPDPFFYFESDTHKEALDHLRFFLENREGLAVIYGDVGLGKTTLSRIFAASLDRGQYNLALVLNPIMDERELLKEILKELDVTADGTKKELFDTLTSFLLEEHKKNKETVLMIDEAQLLSNELLEFIRVLSNIETEKEKVLHILLFSQPEIMERLQAEGMRFLSQRITVLYKLRPFNIDEIKRYISFRLIKSGSKGVPEFRENALRLISMGSQGCPRLVNMLCDRSLLLAYAQSKTVIDEDTVTLVLKEQNISLATSQKETANLSGPVKAFSNPVRLLQTLVVLFAVIIIGGFCFYFLDVRKTPSLPVQPQSGRPSEDKVAARTDENTRAVEQRDSDKGTSSPVRASQNADAMSKSTPIAEAMVMKDAVNIRIKPNIASQRIALLLQGEKIRIFEQKIDNVGQKWYKILLYGDREGWVAESVVKVK